MLLQSAVVARVLPFALFILFLAVDAPLGAILEQAGVEARWTYCFRAGAAALGLIWFWRGYDELRQAEPPPLRQWLIAAAVGSGVFAMWVLPYPDWATQGGGGRAIAPVDAQGALDWAWVAVRSLGAALVVPVMEELFWRSFLMRWMHGTAFINMQPSAITLRTVLIVSVLFATVHELWLAGFLAGVAYGMLYRLYGSLWLPIFAHALTNAMVAAWAVWTSQWQYW